MGTSRKRFRSGSGRPKSPYSVWKIQFLRFLHHIENIIVWTNIMTIFFLFDKSNQYFILFFQIYVIPLIFFFFDTSFIKFIFFC